MGYLPGFATPRLVCDVPFVGKRWVHQSDEYDAVKGISYWSKNYRTGLEMDDPEAVRKTHVYYDPVHALPENGQQWWIDQGFAKGAISDATAAAAAASRAAAAADVEVVLT
jgi:lysine 2,3-aminomutase